MKLRVGRVCAGALVTGATVVLASCGGAGGGGSPKTIATAAQGALTHGAIWILTLDDPRPFGGGGVTVVGRGAFISHPTTIGYEVIQRSRSGQPFGGRSFLVFLPDRVYLQPAMGAALPLGRPWLVAGAAGAKPTGDVGRFLEQAEGLNPQLLLHELVWAVTAVSGKDQIVVRHTPLSRYTVTIDLRRAARAAGASTALRVAVDAQIAALGSRKPLVEAAVAIDPLGRIAQLETQLPGSRFGTSSLRLTAYDVKLRRSLPPAPDVIDLASLARSRPAFVSSPWAAAR